LTQVPGFTRITPVVEVTVVARVTPVGRRAGSTGWIEAVAFPAIPSLARARIAEVAAAIVTGVLSRRPR
jgi:hypothetical protein